MSDASPGTSDPTEILRRSIQSDRVHSSYLLTGSGAAPVDAARNFARALVCRSGSGTACEACPACQRSSEIGDDGEPIEPIALDSEGKRGPTHRHIGDHPDLLWVERSADRTRIRIRQVRDIQQKLRLGANEGGRRAAVIAGAEMLNIEAQNALLRLLEEPPPLTSIVLVAERASAIIATIRSRSVRVRFPIALDAGIRNPEASDSVQEIVATLDGLRDRSVGDILDLAEQYRGARAVAAEGVTELIDVSAAWLCEDVKERVRAGERPAPRELDAHRSLQQLRRDLIGRNANPQMVAERLLLGLRDAIAR